MRYLWVAIVYVVAVVINSNDVFTRVDFNQDMIIFGSRLTLVVNVIGLTVGGNIFFLNEKINF